MVRSRVLSFMSQFGGTPKGASTSSSSPVPSTRSDAAPPRADLRNSASPQPYSAQDGDSPTPPRSRAERPPSRPMSMIQTWNPPVMEVAHDTLPELQPIFTFLNSHSNKLYQEGYFLKLNDLDTNGRPNADRNWTECFAQLVGTVLSLWDAAALDAAGSDGEVVPTFINLTDASIKMIETLPTRSKDVQPLQNVLSISTAGQNRYLLHFNSLHSLTQWTAGIRLAMFEHATLQECYTGSLIAGKGKTINSIKTVMERSRLDVEDWCRVRFGAGTPWRRCWCVISPPNQKEYLKQQKLAKKSSIYARAPPLKGDIKFYDAKRTKKSLPIATITDAYSAYAIYPQSKPLIDQSTLVKVEGTITIHSRPASTTEGFVFVMPEVHPAVSGFEMMLRWLFPVFDTFALYGRPGKLIADTLDVRGLMFAMPRERRYGYLEILDVAGLIHADGSGKWRELDWRRNMKKLTAERISTLTARSSQGSRAGSRRATRTSLNLPSHRAALHFDDAASTRSNPAIREESLNRSELELAGQPVNSDLPPPGPPYASSHHQRSVSEAQGMDRYTARMENARESPPPPPPHMEGLRSPELLSAGHSSHSIEGLDEGSSSGSEPQNSGTTIHELASPPQPEPVAAPPAFARRGSAKGLPKPHPSPELRRANSRMSTATLSQMAGASNLAAAAAAASWNAAESRKDSNQQGTEVSRQMGPHEMSTSPIVPPGQFSNDSMHGPMLANDRANSDGYIAAPNGANLGPRPLPPPPNGAELVQQPVYAPGEHSQIDAMTAGPHDDTKERHHSSDVISPGSTGPTEPHSSGENYAPGSLPLLKTRLSIIRKPVGTPSPTNQSPAGRTDTSLDSLRNHVVDQQALEEAMARVPTASSDTSHLQRDTSISSKYSDATPDYASTRKSTETKRSAASVDKPRAGVMRTVGTAEPEQKEVVVGDVRYKPESKSATERTDIPNVDFGPTLNYAAENRSRPGTSGTMSQPFHERTGSTDSTGRHVSGPAGGSPMNGSPVRESKRSSSALAGPISSGQAYGSRGHSRSPSRALRSQEPEQQRSGSAGSDNDNRRSIAWQPGLANAAGGGPHPHRQSITPEQFVQQRAQQAARTTPVYAHGKRQSSAPLRVDTNGRVQSGDFTPQGHVRTMSGDTPSRPHSRGASIALGQSGRATPPGDYSARLSAREQEHVARVTGSPLLNVAGGSSGRQTPTHGGGLVGAIEAREREKKQIKQGYGGHMVQNAIMQRRQQEVQAQQNAQHYQQNPAYGQSQVRFAPQSPWANAQMGGSPAYTSPQQFSPHNVQGGSPWPNAQMQGQQMQPAPTPPPHQWAGQEMPGSWISPDSEHPPVLRPQQSQQHGSYSGARQ